MATTRNDIDYAVRNAVNLYSFGKNVNEFSNETMLKVFKAAIFEILNGERKDSQENFEEKHNLQQDQFKAQV